MMIEHLKFFITGAIAFLVVLALLAGIAMFAIHFFWLFLVVILAYPTYELGKKIVMDHRDTVAQYGKDWWKN